jgi:hypothetical protein
MDVGDKTRLLFLQMHGCSATARGLSARKTPSRELLIFHLVGTTHFFCWEGRNIRILGEKDGALHLKSLEIRLTIFTGFLYFWHLGRPIIINRKLDLSYYTGDIPDETIVRPLRRDISLEN